MHQIIFSNFDDKKNPFYGGGGAVSIHEIAKRLAKRFKVDVITARYPGSHNEIVDGVTYKRIGLSWVGPHLGQIIFAIVLPYYAMRLKYDIWFESLTPPFSFSFLPMFTQRTVVGLVHMLPAVDMERKYILPFRIVENIGIRLYRKFVVLSKSIKRQIESKNSNAEVWVIPNGIDSTPEKPNNQKPQHILFMGRIEVDQKGLDLLIKAYKSISDTTTLPLVIAGSGIASEVKKLKRIITEAKLTEKIKLVGRVTGDIKDNLFRKSACVVVPSRFETFSLVALETIYFKKPLVTFDIDGLSWIPSDCSAKSIPFEVDSLANSILKVTSNSKYAQELVKKADQMSKKMTWENSAKSYEKSINSIISYK